MEACCCAEAVVAMTAAAAAAAAGGGAEAAAPFLLYQVPILSKLLLGVRGVTIGGGTIGLRLPPLLPDEPTSNCGFAG